MTEQQRYEMCARDIGTLLQKISGAFQVMEREMTRDTGLSGSQFLFLFELNTRGTVTLMETSRIMNLEKSSASRMIAILEKKGLIRRSRNIQDRRTICITLSSTGRQALSEAEEIRQAFYRRMIDNLPRGHVREVMNSAEILFQALESSLV